MKAAPAPDSAAEILRARQYLEQTRDGVIAAVAGLSDEQWRFKPAPDSWSIGETVEHIAIVVERIGGPILQQLAAAPAPPEGTDHRAIDELIATRFPDRSNKFKGPEALMPSGTWPASVALDRLRQATARLSERLVFTPDLRAHAMEALPLQAISGGKYKSMDGYQWILTCAAHTERHIRQIEEVKADRHFPPQ